MSEEVEEITIAAPRGQAAGGGDIADAVDGEIVQVPAADAAAVTGRNAFARYVYLPLIFLTSAMLGGIRLDSLHGDLIFVRPPLLCLIFAAILLVLFFRSGLMDFEGWFSERLSGLQTAANAAVALSLFAASVQLFNSLLPERGLPFWVVGFCFLWTLWNNLFADFDTRKLLRSLGALFGLAFVVKYLVLLNVAPPDSGRGWLASVIEDPAREAFTRLLDLPRFAPGTGYIQFFTAAIYLVGLFLIPRSASDADQ